MFYYYGRKKKLIRSYPPPKFKTIIEPFAGSASYACAWAWNRRVILVDKNPEVASLWKWLVNDATPEELMAIPDLKIGDKTSSFLQILHSSSKRAFDYKTITATKVISTNWNSNKPKMAWILPMVKEWEIICGDYKSAPDIEATWFIDPPYQGEAGTGYRNGSGEINYGDLAEWVFSRRGQVIVCGHPDDNWLPFQPLSVQSTINGKKNSEGIFVMDGKRQEGNPSTHPPDFQNPIPQPLFRLIGFLL